MSYFVWIEIVCAGCSLTSQGQFTTGRIPLRDMAKAAKAQGWKRQDKDWFCACCSKEKGIK